MEPCAQLDAAQNRTGSAAQTTCTVLLLLLTAICCNEGEACQDGCQEAVSGYRVPSWMLPRTELVLLPRQHVLCCYCCPFVAMKEKLVKMA